MRPNTKQKIDEVAREERRKKVAANLLAGLTYRQMAEVFGVALSTIADDVKIVIGRWQREQVQDAGEYVQLEMVRLDRAINAIWNKVETGDPKAIDTMLKIMERRAKYKGLDAPTRQEVTGEIKTKTESDVTVDATSELKEFIRALQDTGFIAAAQDDQIRHSSSDA